jgi:pimeloyl-ACP methyl ester carboxylesterase
VNERAVRAGQAESELHFVDNGAGHRLALRRVTPAVRRGRPVVIVPGYQMNSSVFGYHPGGASLEAHLAGRGIEVWSVDLRGQGKSLRTWGEERFGLGELAIEDVGAVLAYVRGAARSDRVDVIGCSLGTALIFAHVACVPEAKVGSIVAMGGVVTWAHVNRALRLVARAASVTGAVGRIRMRGTRRLARAALPAVTRIAPGLLSMYLNVESTDTSDAAALTLTVEDPNPVINRQVARWLAKRELVIRGVNVSRALASMEMPLLCVIGLQDGVVPPATSRALFDGVGSRDKALLEVGTRDEPMAHADLFLARRAPELVFEPIATWLLAHV